MTLHNQGDETIFFLQICQFQKLLHVYGYIFEFGLQYSIGGYDWIPFVYI